MVGNILSMTVSVCSGRFSAGCRVRAVTETHSAKATDKDMNNLAFMPQKYAFRPAFCLFACVFSIQLFFFTHNEVSLPQFIRIPIKSLFSILIIMNKMEITPERRERRIYKVTVLGSVVNLLLLVFKFIAGIAGHSAAMLADAVHSLSDFITDIIVIVFVRISSKPEDEGHDYGHGKYETLATAIIGLILLLVGAGVFWNGVSSIWHVIHGGTLQAPGMLALVAAIVSVLSKEILYRYTVREGRLLDSQAVVANAWHHRSDAFSSVGTTLGIGGAILLGDNWRVLDPIAAVVVSLFIMKVSVKLLAPCMDELLDKSLPAEVENRITDTILASPGVTSPHHLRTRRIGSHYSIEVHVRMDGRLTLEEAHAKATTIEHKLRQEFGEGTYISIHVEPDKKTISNPNN